MQICILTGIILIVQQSIQIKWKSGVTSLKTHAKKTDQHHFCLVESSGNKYQLESSLKTIWSGNITYRYHDAKKICTHLSGSMSMNPGGKREYILGDIENCFSPDSGEIRFWIPVKQGQSVKGTNGQYLWLDDRPNSNGTVVQAQTWNTGQPNGLHIQQCVDASEQGNWYDMECEETKRCSVCVIPVAQIFRLRGQHNFEREYSLSFEMQKSTKRVIFEGLEQSSIVIWYPMEEKTELMDQEQNVTTTFYQNPFGLLGSRKDIIRNDGYTDQLVFTNVSLQSLPPLTTVIK